MRWLRPASLAGDPMQAQSGQRSAEWERQDKPLRWPQLSSSSTGAFAAVTFLKAIEKLRGPKRSDRGVTLREVAEELGLPATETLAISDALESVGMIDILDDDWANKSVVLTKAVERIVKKPAAIELLRGLGLA